MRVKVKNYPDRVCVEAFCDGVAVAGDGPTERDARLRMMTRAWGVVRELRKLIKQEDEALNGSA